jgi:GrpB-like predicted nucleotidyltransferase (UPF0157 family)
MSKSLEEMSLEELWRLFPVFLVHHNPAWKDYYEEEKVSLLEVLKNIKSKRISHIGSTAIQTIKSKSIIDILIELDENDLSIVIPPLLAHGYILMSRDQRKLSFNKGYTNEGFEEKVFHIHVRHVADNDELYFRDYLIEHPNVAKTYEQLKLALAKKFKYNRDLYTIKKTHFIKKVVKRAKKIYLKRYDI